MQRLLLALVTLGFSIPLIAAEHESAVPEERIQHYEVQAPKNSAEALLVVEDSLKTIETDLATNKLEAIHKQSYHLEAALETLRKDTKAKDHADTIDTMDEAVQIVHFASENGESEKIRNELPVLKAAAERISKLFKATETYR